MTVLTNKWRDSCIQTLLTSSSGDPIASLFIFSLPKHFLFGRRDFHFFYFRNSREKLVVNNLVIVGIEWNECLFLAFPFPFLYFHTLSGSLYLLFFVSFLIMWRPSTFHYFQSKPPNRYFSSSVSMFFFFFLIIYIFEFFDCVYEFQDLQWAAFMRIVFSAEKQKGIKFQKI